METKLIEDAVTAGFLAALGCSVSPQLQTDGKVRFIVRGDYEAATDRLYRNESVPAMEALQHVKAFRAAIFNLKKENGKGNSYGINGNHR